MAQSSILWGTITLDLDNEAFREAFFQGRSTYFDDSEFDIPHVASHMNTLDAVGSVLDEDGKGDYRFDRMAFRSPFDILGFFLGYMSGPVLPESPEERKARYSRIVRIPEEASPARMSL